MGIAQAACHGFAGALGYLARRRLFQKPMRVMQATETTGV
jgi:hypothetical protein